MLVWLIKDGENLPVQAGARAMRTGMLAHELVRRGHSVVWWSSTFSHQRKQLLYDQDTDVAVEPGFTLKLLHSGVYERNISLQRRRHHRRLAGKFRERAQAMDAPDVAVAAFPQIDLAREVVVYANARDFPVIVDVRDLWPDTLVEKLPGLLQTSVRTLVSNEYRKTAVTLRGADSLVAISHGCLQWALRFADRSQAPDDAVFYTSYPVAPEEQPETSGRIEELQRTLAGKVVFTFIGSFGHSYELKLICDVAHRALNMNLQDVHFVLAGDGQQFKTLSRRAKSLPNMSLTGWLDQHEIQQLLRRSDVGILPCVSVADAMPNKAFEYMSSGLPIVSSLRGEFEHVLSETDAGFSYRSGDAKALYGHVSSLAHDPALRHRLAGNSRSVFMKKFRTDTTYDAYADHVERLARNKNKMRNKT